MSASRSIPPAGAAPRRRPESAAAIAIGAMALVPLLFLAVFFVWPVLTMIGRGLIVDGALDLSGFGEVFASARIRRVIWLTVAQAVVATGVSTALGLPLAFVAYRLRFPGRGVLRALAVMPFVMPTVVVGIAFRTLLAPGGALGGLGLDGTWSAIIAALVFFNISVVVRTVGVAWEGLDPRAGEVAASLGASPWQVGGARGVFPTGLPQRQAGPGPG